MTEVTFFVLKANTTMPKKQVNIGAIGVGVFMARKHLPNIMRNPGIRLHTLCDINADLLKQREREYHPKRVTSDAESVFKDPEVDAVLVGTRSNQHARLVLQAAASRKHIYVEKPMTMTFEETDSVLKAVRKSGIIIGVGFNRRFAPSLVEARNLFKSYKKGPANVIYRIVDDHRIRPHYIFDMNDGGGHLLQEGCHIFDLLAWFLEEEPVEIYAIGPLETDNSVIIKYSGGSSATMVCGGKGGLCYPKEAMEVFCANSTLALDSFYELRFDGPGRNFIRTFPPHVQSKVKLPEESMTGFYKAEFAARPTFDIVGPHAANDLPTPSVDKGHEQAMAAFAESIVTGKPYSIGVVAGARATVCALKAYESIRTNRPVAICPREYGL